jgi:hypothetical protein
MWEIIYLKSKMKWIKDACLHFNNDIEDNNEKD